MGGEKQRYVAYFRVSTQRQGRSGLGLEGQREAVRAYINGNGDRVLAEYTEVESGRRDDNRPELAKALAACRLHSAVLCIARLDRLSRDAAFLLTLQKGEVRFVAADMPHADETVVGFMAVMARAEGKAISERTRAALAAARRRGVKLGRPGNFTDEGRAKGRRASALAVAAKARARAADVLPTIRALRAEGMSLGRVAAALNDRPVPIPAPRGGRWYATSVKNCLALDDGDA